MNINDVEWYTTKKELPKEEQDIIFITKDNYYLGEFENGLFVSENIGKDEAHLDFPTYLPMDVPFWCYQSAYREKELFVFRNRISECHDYCFVFLTGALSMAEENSEFFAYLTSKYEILKHTEWDGILNTCHLNLDVSTPEGHLIAEVMKDL